MIDHNQVSQFDTNPAEAFNDVPALSAQPFSPDLKAVPWAVETQPTAAEISSVGQACLKANMALPKDVSASMINAGKKAIIANPNQPDGSWQESGITVTYPAPTCLPDQFKRIGRAIMEIRHADGSVYYLGGANGKNQPFWSKTYTRAIAGSGGTSWAPSGHEGDSYYWHVGDHVFAKYDTIVKSVKTGKTVAVSETKTVPTSIHRGRQ